MARNPYQMDPFLQQGFSNLTKALIGDAETDYQVARTNRVNELLPLEKQQMQANIAVDNARRTLLAAQTLTEDQLRDPRVQTELARAKQLLSAAGKDDALGGLYSAQTQTENELRTPRVNSENANTANIEAQTESRLADAMLTDARTKTEDELRTPRVNTQNAQTSAFDAQAADRNASAQQTADLTPSMIQENQARAGEYNAGARKNDALARKADAEADAATREVLKAGETIVTINADGERETYTAPENVSVTLEPGEEATIFMADGTEKKVKGPPIANKRKDSDAKSNNAEIDRQIDVFFNTDSGSFPNVSPTVLKRIRSSLYNDENIAGKAPDVAAQVINDTLSQTRNGQSEIKIATGFNDGVGAFYIPAFVANAIAQGLPIDTIVELYGLSREQAKLAQAELTAR